MGFLLTKEIAVHYCCTGENSLGREYPSTSEHLVYLILAMYLLWAIHSILFFSYDKMFLNATIFPGDFKSCQFDNHRSMSNTVYVLSELFISHSKSGGILLFPFYRWVHWGFQRWNIFQISGDRRWCLKHSSPSHLTLLPMLDTLLTWG